MSDEDEIKIVGKIGKVTVGSISLFARRKNILTCQGYGKGDPNCLEENHPEGFFMIDGHECGGGVICRGYCQAVFTRPEDNPDLFEDRPELLPRLAKK